MLRNLRIVIVLLVICGIGYPLFMTGAAQIIMPDQAEGSLIKNEAGEVIGSKQIGQSFQEAKYFHGRISSIEYDAAASGTPNYAPSNEEMILRTKEEMERFLKKNPGVKKEEIPAELVTNSGSGLDPHISPEGAIVQIPRIAAERGISEESLRKLVDHYTEGRNLGLFGEPKVNVLMLNIAMDE